MTYKEQEDLRKTYNRLLWATL